MKKTLLTLATMIALTTPTLSVSVDLAAAEDAKTAAPAADSDTTITALKIAAKEKIAQAKALIAEKAKQASEAAKAAYEKAKTEYAASQTPEAKADRAAKFNAAKLAALEKLAQAKVIIAEKAQKLAEAAKAEYEKLKAAVTEKK